MKKVLIIANQFPPMGGSGVQRTLKFVKHLRTYGYEPVVLTRDIGNMKLRDNSMLADIPEGVQIIRTRNRDLTELSGVLALPGKLIARKILIPDAERLWANSAFKTAEKLLLSEDIQLIYSTSYPYSDHLLAMKLKKRFPCKKWLADFRDEWTNNPYTLDNPHSKFRTNKEKKLEKAVVSSADFLLTNTPVMLENFVRNNGLSSENTAFIPNGYDLDDFKGLDLTPPKNERFTMTYAGLLYGRRKPDTFFAALQSLINAGKINKEEIDIRLIGNYNTKRLTEAIERYGLTGVVRILPYMPHRECVAELLKSDALLLLEGSGMGADAFYTGKIFEYMNTGRTVLCVLPVGCARDLALEAKIGQVADFDSSKEIADEFYNIYKKYKSGTLAFEPNREVINRFERGELTKRLAEIFDGMLKT